MPSTIKVPSSLFITFQAALKMEAKRVCRDAAKLLQRPEAEVLELLLDPTQQISIQILNDKDITDSCPVLLKHSHLLERCRIPCVLGTGRCLKHQTITQIPDIPSSVQSLTRLECTEDHQIPLWCDETTGIVYDSTGSIVGNYKNERLELFLLEI
jgi:hypothetical protein